MPLLTPWGTPSSLSGGRILKCFPQPIARSAARSVAGRTLKNEPAEVRGSGTGWREENSALCSQRIASLVVLDTLRPSVQLPTCLGSLPGERNHLYLGAEFEMLQPPIAVIITASDAPISATTAIHIVAQPI